ncbi:tumor necrosis factor receptor superfamily member 10B isoform X2 [Pipistrellus kuhlii]|uniref:tumor necrosis factor receptor superfamily member 10B isoform X2 n=1 Tax=Pipistrellus kuhlii TaxID=59472 RepID=UPI001E271CD6|nr:tumor necrosis factor receptor superfamily member 10B isoform X2 [Pipistrellus kuhlii]
MSQSAPLLLLHFISSDSLSRRSDTAPRYAFAPPLKYAEDPRSEDPFAPSPEARRRPAIRRPSIAGRRGPGRRPTARGQTAARRHRRPPPAAMSPRRPGPWAPGARILALALLCLLRPVPVASPTLTKLDRVRQQPAASLTGKCPPGSYLSEYTGACIECTEGEDFTSHHNSFYSCRPCSHCPPDKVETAPCTRTKDTQCQCKNGTYEDKDSPEFCLPCSHRCPDGKVKAKACGPWNDLECVDQRSGIPWWIIFLICISVLIVLALIGLYCCKRYNLGSGVATKITRRGWFWRSQTTGDTEALDNAHNQAINNRDSLSSEQEQEELVQPTEEAQHLLGRAGPDGSPMTRKLLVPANNENPIETLRESFLVFSEFVPLRRQKRFMKLVGLTENDIYIAQNQESHPRDALYEMLNIWLYINGKAASVNTLLKSLEDMKEMHVKEMIEERLLRSGKYVYEGGEAGSAVSSENDDLRRPEVS